MSDYRKKDGYAPGAPMSIQTARRVLAAARHRLGRREDVRVAVELPGAYIRTDEQARAYLKRGDR